MCCKVIHNIFGDEDSTYLFRRDLTRLAAVLMPIARAIQCLESATTNAADVYRYWLAIVAQLKDLFERDNLLRDKMKYPQNVKEDLRRIVNYRFKALIDSERAMNIYLLAFALDPGESQEIPVA